MPNWSINSVAIPAEQGAIVLGAENKPTIHIYNELQVAFDFFNQALFSGKNPDCLITLQRRMRTLGYFSPARFVKNHNNAVVTDEIAMNPNSFGARSLKETLSTLVHEMAHQWQSHYGLTGANGYHNREWAAKMEIIGLMPSRTGLPGGKRTGRSMTHYIIENGPFDRCCDSLLSDEFQISWADRFGEKNRRRQVNGGIQKPVVTEKVKYKCDNCQITVVGRQSLTLFCHNCDGNLELKMRAIGMVSSECIFRSIPPGDSVFIRPLIPF